LTRFRKINIADVWPPGAWDLFGPGPIGGGMDVATTTKEKSNPSAIAFTEKLGVDFIVRVAIRFKTDNPAISKAILIYALDRLKERDRRLRKFCVDATNERFFAAGLRDELAGRLWVEPVVSSETMEYLGEKMTVKSYLGNLFVNTIDDGHLFLPLADWLRDDIRQVKEDRGTFVADPDEDGNHADTFDAIKQSLHALVSASGPATAAAAQVGTFAGGPRPLREGIKNPFAKLFERSRGG
jgi:hypothetical protein